MYTWDKRLMIFSLACLACLAWACSPAAFGARANADQTARWGDLANERQLCERLGGVGCSTCAGQPDAAACYRAAYCVAMERARQQAAQPFAREDYADPFAAEELPAPGSPELAEQIREGEATDALHLIEERLREVVRP